MLFGLRQALLFKLNEPLTPLGYLIRTSSPAVYRLLASTVPRIYPSPKQQTPAAVEALVHAVSARRRYVSVGEDPWVVRSGATPRHPTRLQRLEDDPNVQFFIDRNPRFAEGEALLVWVPVDAANLAGLSFRLLYARLSR